MEIASKETTDRIRSGTSSPVTSSGGGLRRLSFPFSRFLAGCLRRGLLAENELRYGVFAKTAVQALE